MEEAQVSTTSSPDGGTYRASPGCESYQPMRVSLVDEEGLWSKFSRLGTEMIVTRRGRQIFPAIQLVLQNLSPYKFYKVYMEIAPVDGVRYRYNKNNWVPKGTPESAVTSAWIEHPQSPAEGYKWMIRPLDFNVKLTNSLENVDGESAYLRSMYKYKIIIHVEEGCNMAQRNPMMTRSFPLINTTFMCVTTYHNPEVKELKTATNIHAKGIRQKKLKQFHDICDDMKRRFSENDGYTTSNPNKRTRLEPGFHCVQKSFDRRNEPTMNQVSPTVPYFSKWSDFYPSPPNFLNRSDPFTIPMLPRYREIEAPAITAGGTPFSTPLTVYCPPPPPFFSLDCPPRYEPLLIPMYPQRCPYNQPLSSRSPHSAGYPTFQDRNVSSTCGSTILNVCPSCRDGFHNCVACATERQTQNSDQATPSPSSDAEITSTFQQQLPYSVPKSSPSPTSNFPTSSPQSDPDASVQSGATDIVSSSIAEAIRLQF